MKKVYEKPMMAVEYYQLTQAIAACSIKIGFLSSECVKNDPDATIEMKNLAWDNWFVQEGACAQIAVDMDNDDGICYHTNVNAAFNS